MSMPNPKFTKDKHSASRAKNISVVTNNQNEISRDQDKTFEEQDFARADDELLIKGQAEDQKVSQLKSVYKIQQESIQQRAAPRALGLKSQEDSIFLNQVPNASKNITANIEKQSVSPLESIVSASDRKAENEKQAQLDELENSILKLTAPQRQAQPPFYPHPEPEGVAKVSKTRVPESQKDNAALELLQKAYEQERRLTFNQEEGNVTGRMHDSDIKLAQQSLRYGDIITFKFDKSIHYSEQGLLKLLIYRGVLHCNGITQLRPEIISRNFMDRREAFCNFKNCLFKIESCSSLDINHKVFSLKQKIAKLKEEQEKAKVVKNDETFQTINELKAKIKKLDDNITQLEDYLARENKDNKYLNSKLQDSKVLYGDHILLKHVESGKYLSLSEEPAEENGCSATKLMPLNEFSSLSISPSDSLRQNGQIILYQDSFHIQSFVEPSAIKQAQYLHISLSKLQKKASKARRIGFELNSSTDVTAFKARLFQPSSEISNIPEDINDSIISGSVIQFYHKQTNGFLSVKMENVLEHSDKLQYHEQVQEEIRLFKEAEKKIKEAIKVAKKQNQQTTGDGHIEINDQFVNEEDEESEELKNEESWENKTPPKVHIPEVLIEIDSKDSNKARYLWEIQKLQPFLIQNVRIKEYYRIKHVQTGLYLCVSESSNQNGLDVQKQSLNSLDLLIKPLEDSENFLFTIFRDTRTDDSVDDHHQKNLEIKNLSLIIIKSKIQETYLQSIPKNSEEELQELEKNKSIFQSSDQIHELSYQAVKCQEQNKESYSFQIFTIIKAKPSQANLVQVTNNHFESSKTFFYKLSKFALIKNQSLRTFGHIYDLNRAKKKEVSLEKEANQFKSNIQDLQNQLRQLYKTNQDGFVILQNYLAEQGVVDLYVKILELIVLRTTPPHERYQYSNHKRDFEYYRSHEEQFENQKQKLKDYSIFTQDKQHYETQPVYVDDKVTTVAQLSQGIQGHNFLSNTNNVFLNMQDQQKEARNNFEGEESVYEIVQNIVATISGELMLAIILMIKRNYTAALIIDKYSDILFTQLWGNEIKKAKALFRTLYKLSAQGQTKGDYQSCAEAAKRQRANRRSLARWIDLIVDTQSNEKVKNLKQQRIFMKLISLICQDANGEGIYENQMYVYERLLLNKNQFRRIYFALNKDNQKPYIQFALRGQEAEDKEQDQQTFLSQNHELDRLLIRRDINIDHRRHIEDSKSPEFDLFSIFNDKATSVYAKYILQYIDLINYTIKSGHHEAFKFPSQIGLSGSFALLVINQTNDSRLKQVFVKLLTSMYINNDRQYGYYGLKNRCYYWKLISNGKVSHKTLQLSDNLVNQQQHSLENEKQKKKTTLSTLIPRETQKSKEAQQEQNRLQEKSLVYSYLPEIISQILMVEESLSDQNVVSDNDVQELQLSDKEISKQLKFIKIALKSAQKLIKCEKSTPILIYRIIYSAAAIFYQFQYREKQSSNEDQHPDQEQKQTKNPQFRTNKLFQLFTLAGKKEKASKFQSQIEHVYIAMLQNLILISEQKTDHQIMIALKYYKAQVGFPDFFASLEEFQKSGLLKQINQDSLGKCLSIHYSLEANQEAIFDNNFINLIEDSELQLECGNLNSIFAGRDGRKIRYNIKQLLLFLIFDNQLRSTTKSLAFKVLMLNFDMVINLRHEMSKVYIITEEEQEEYGQMQETRSKIVYVISDIIWYSYNTLKDNRLRDQDKCNDVIAQCQKYINELYQDLLEEHNKNYKQKQKFLNVLEIPRLLIDSLMKNVNYNEALHKDLFVTIIQFLYYYSQNNQENCKSLTSYLPFLSSLQQINISNEKLITQIVQQLKNQSKETQLIDHIFRQIKNSIDQVQNIPSLLKSLNSLARNSVFNKGNIFNKIIKMEVYHKYIYFQLKTRSDNKDKQEKSNSEEKIYKSIENYRKLYNFCNENYDRSDKNPFRDFAIKMDFSEIQKHDKKLLNYRYKYITHRRLISLLILCCLDQPNAIPQVAKIAPLNRLVNIMRHQRTPYIVRKKYLRLLLTVHFSKDEDFDTQSYSKDSTNIKDLMALVIYNDIIEFPIALQKAFEKSVEKKLEQLAHQSHQLQSESKTGSIPQLQELDQKISSLRGTVNDQNVMTIVENLQNLLLPFAQQFQSINQVAQRANRENIEEEKQAQEPPSSATTATGKYLQSLENVDQLRNKENLISSDKSYTIIQALIEESKQNFINWKNSKIFRKYKKVKNQEIKNTDLEKIMSKYINSDDPSEYWRYLSSQSNSLNTQDGLLHFIKEFFQRAKQSGDTSLIELIRELIVPLNCLKDVLQQMAGKSVQIIKECDLLIVKTDEALTELHYSLQFLEDKVKEQENLNNRNQNVTAGGNNVLVNYDVSYGLAANTNRTQFVEDSMRFDKKNGPGYNSKQTPGNQLFKGKDMEINQKIYWQNHDENIYRFNGMREESLKIKNYYKLICDYLLKQKVGLNKFFNLETYEKKHSIKKDQFQTILNKNLEQIGETSLIAQFCQHVLDQQKSRLSDDEDLEELKQLFNTNDNISLGLFNEQIKQFLENEQTLQYRTQERYYLDNFLKQGYIDEPSKHQQEKNSFKIFANVIFYSKHLKTEKDLEKIIHDIMKTFEEQQDPKQYKKDLNNFVSNMIDGLNIKDQRYYILNVLRGILKQYKRNSVVDIDSKEFVQARNNSKYYNHILSIMKERRLAENLLKFLNNAEEKKVALLSIKILIILLEGMTNQIQTQIFDFILNKKNEVKVAEFLKSEIEYYTPKVISQKFNLIKEQSLGLLKKYQKLNRENQNQISEFEHKIVSNLPTVKKVQIKRHKKISEFSSILRFIQLCCDNCHSGFQDYFRDQLSIQLTTANQSSYQSQIIEESIESSSTFNIILIVAKSFMKMTKTFRELIYFDEINIEKQSTLEIEQQLSVAPQKEENPNLKRSKYSLASLMQTFIEVIIDFVYGPCEQNQLLLSGWELFLNRVNFYFKSRKVHFFSQNASHDARFQLMYKASLLLLGIVENPNTTISKQIFEDLKQGFSLDNLQQTMVEIYEQKIFSIEGSYDAFKSRKKLKEVDGNNLQEKEQLQSKNCLKPSDEIIFEIGFNIFKFLYIAERLSPQEQFLRINESKSKQEEDRMEEQYRSHLTKFHESIAYNSFDDQATECEQTLRFLWTYISYLDGQNSHRSKEEQNRLFNLLRFHRLIVKMIRDPQNARSIFQKNAISFGNTSLEFMQHLKISVNNMELPGQNEPNLNKEGDVKQQIKNLIEDLDQEELKKNQNSKKEIETLKYNQFVEFDGSDELNFVDGNFKEQDIKNFALLKACRFYSEFIAEVEVDYRGQLVRSIFKIPQECAFLSAKTRKGILYGQKSSSLYDKLEAIFQQMPSIIEEMRSNQKLSRASKPRFLISEYNVMFQNLSSIFIVLINLLYLIFYVRTEDGSEVIEYDSLYIVVFILKVAQAAISLIIHIGYLEKYHRVYDCIHNEHKLTVTHDQFTGFKGSLGFAKGMMIIKQPRNILKSKAHLNKGDYERQLDKAERRRNLLSRITYGLRIYLIGLTLDSIHTFNLLYLIFSVGAIEYPILFSVLLLENVLQIPILFNVIKAIVNNRRQILLTLLLLLVIVYVYSFIAFKAFPGNFQSVDTTAEGESPPALNNYCHRLGLCFATTLNNGIRSGGGIGDQLDQLSLHDDLFWARYAFDLTFYIMIIVLLLNLIFGIIIDAFAAMRDESNEVEKEVMEKCFICGLPASHFESKKKSFSDHIQKEHNLFSYIYYIYYLSRKSSAECTGVERYVQQFIAKEDPQFFPINKALSSLENDEEQDHHTHSDHTRE